MANVNCGYANVFAFFDDQIMIPIHTQVRNTDVSGALFEYGNTGVIVAISFFPLLQICIQYG